MGNFGRLLLLFSLAWAGFWAAPVSVGQEGATVSATWLQADLPAAWTHREVSETVTETSFPDGLGQAGAKSSGAAARPPIHQQALAWARTASPRAGDILLLIQRQNE